MSVGSQALPSLLHGTQSYGQELDHNTLAMLAVVLVATLLLLYRTGRSKNGIPFVPGIPVIHDDIFAVSKTSTHDRNLMLEIASTRRAKYGDLYWHHYVGRALTVHGADNVRKILGGEHTFVEAAYPPSVDRLLGRYNLLNQKGPQHKITRKLLQPLFGPAALRTYLPEVQRIMESKMEQWIQAEGGIILARDEFKAVTLEVFVKLLMGVDLKEAEKDLHGYDLGTAWMQFANGLISLPFNLPGTDYYKALKARPLLIQLVDHCIEQHKARQAAGAEPCTMKSVLEALMEATDEEGNPLPHEYLQDMSIIVMLAGHDTTSITMIRMVKLLAMHPEAMEKLREEEKKVVSTHGKTLTEAALREMEYAEMVIRETLRIGTIVPNIARLATEDISVGDHIIKKGSRMWLNMVDTLHNNLRWRHETGPLAPDSFNPDRWSDQEAVKEMGWLFFGHGRRMCIGYNLAILELKVFLALLARGYEFDLMDPDEPWKFFPLFNPTRGLPLRLRAVAAN